MLFVIVQSLCRVWLFVTSWTAACQASLSLTTSRRLLKVMSIELVMAFNYFTLSPSSLFAFHLSWYQGLFQ